MPKYGSKIDDGSLTPTQQRLSDALDDGKLWPLRELAKLIDEFCTDDNARMHLSNLRTRLRQRGLQTVVVENGQYCKVSYLEK